MIDHNYLSTPKFIEAALQLRHSSEFNKLLSQLRWRLRHNSKYDELPKPAAFAVVVQPLVSCLLIST